MNSPSDDQKVLYQLSLCAGLVAAIPDAPPKDLAEKLYGYIQYNLERYRKQLGEWEIVWGPIVLLDGVLPGGSQAKNSMYVAKREKSHSENNNPWYVIAVAGTNPTSLFDWLSNFNVEEMVSWQTVMKGIKDNKDIPPAAGISKSIYEGLYALLQGKPTGKKPNGEKLPQVGNTLVKFLSGEPKPITLTTTGHSKGGALASTLALWLKDSQFTPQEHPCAWDKGGHSKIDCMPTAGPTAGNEHFAAYSDRILTTVTRFANYLDIVPHAWNPTTLEEIRKLYEPAIPTEHDLTVNSLVKCAKARAKKGATCLDGGNYTQIQPELLWRIKGEINKDIILPFPTRPFANFSAQAICQHTGAYDSYFKIEGVEINPPPPNPPRIQYCKQPIYLPELPTKCQQERGQG